MAAEGSVTGWIAQLQEGNTSAAQKLWERYFQRLVALARKKIEGLIATGYLKSKTKNGRTLYVINREEVTE